ncbi:MAG TPA: hypothetical protein VNH11_31600 [Pirellulales bacterium]|nr:hypothetical protein [Pirellulales bacterium]
MLAEEKLDECKARLDSSASLDPRLLELLDSAASRVVEAELDRIVVELDVDFRVLPEGAIVEAREHRDLIVPRLMGAIKDAMAAARGPGATVRVLAAVEKSSRSVAGRERDGGAN